MIVGLQRLKTLYSLNLNGIKTMQNFLLISKMLRFFLISKLFRKMLKVCFKQDIGKTSTVFKIGVCLVLSSNESFTSFCFVFTNFWNTPIPFTIDFEKVGLIPFASLSSSKILEQPGRFRFRSLGTSSLFRFRSYYISD